MSDQEGGEVEACRGVFEVCGVVGAGRGSRMEDRGLEDLSTAWLAIIPAWRGKEVCLGSQNSGGVGRRIVNLRLA